tara:strand:+ start:418 stop:1113 length:696 start_codon:yes stop_codon:yes gene_type:complete
MSAPNPKETAGRRAAEMVEDGMTVGLGTGSTVHFTLLRLAERIRDEGLKLIGVPTSIDTETKARELGIPLATLDDVDAIDLTIDGADEVDPAFNLTKGGGGALLREKVVAHISKREAVVVGRAKLVERLGTTFLLPVEVVPFARPVVAREISGLGADPILRQGASGDPYLTDNGNEILDCKFPDGIADPAQLEFALDRIPGVVESGLFVGLAHALVIGNDDGSCEVRELPN